MSCASANLPFKAGLAPGASAPRFARLAGRVLFVPCTPSGLLLSEQSEDSASSSASEPEQLAFLLPILVTAGELLAPTCNEAESKSTWTRKGVSASLVLQYPFAAAPGPATQQPAAQHGLA
jgi:hypothetical protein